MPYIISVVLGIGIGELRYRKQLVISVSRTDEVQ